MKFDRDDSTPKIVDLNKSIAKLREEIESNHSELMDEVKAIKKRQRRTEKSIKKHQRYNENLRIYGTPYPKMISSNAHPPRRRSLHPDGSSCDGDCIQFHQTDK